MTRINASLLFAFALAVFCAPVARATSHTAASCSGADVQASINAASSGDTVLVPGGNCTWTTNAVTIPNTKYITLDGQGITTINWSGSGTFPGSNVSVFVINNGTAGRTIVTGFTFNGAYEQTSGTACPILINTTYSPVTQAFRLHHNTFNYLDAAGSQGTIICQMGNGPGLIDHNTFVTSHGASELIHNWGDYSTAWTGQDVVPGGSQFLYLEDNTFTYNQGGLYYGTSAIQSYDGARVVFRHNHLYQMQIDAHGSSPNSCTNRPNTRWFEIYNNDFHTTATNANQSNFIVIRGGSGVIFGNIHPNGESNEGAGTASLYNECSIYPYNYDVGFGMSGNHASPVYAWNNINIPVTSASSNVQIGLSPGACQLVSPNHNSCDVVSTASQPVQLTRCQSAADVSAGCPVSYNYVPYQYPHPLTTTGTTGNSLVPPKNLTVSIQ
jgi:hypothetical protein